MIEFRFSSLSLSEIQSVHPLECIVVVVVLIDDVTMMVCI